MYNLLTDPLIRVRLVTGESASLSLPAVYEAASTDSIAAFPALRPHQRHAWHAFLAQLGVIALHRADLAAPRTAAEWRSLLRGLTREFKDDEPWRLVVNDPDMPAFMQCPAGTTLSQYRKRFATPDDLDLLVTAKNHDVKQAVATESASDDWVFALIDLQTMAGFLGRGNYGVSRMNGGFSARPCLGLAPHNQGAGAHLFKDIERMLANRPLLLQEYPDYFRAEGGAALLWTVLWDGTTSFSLADLDPYFIEVCRRARLVLDDQRIMARTTTTTKPRVAAKAAKGDVGDFWIPVDRGDAKALSLSSAGFRYDKLAELLFDRGAYRLPQAMTVHETSKKKWRLVARGMAGGKGETSGYHERNDIVFGPKTVTAFGRQHERDELAAISEAVLEETKEVSRALRFGVAVAASGGKPRTADLTPTDWTKASPYARRLDAAIDSLFFKAVERRFVAETAAAKRNARRIFVSSVVATAGALLDEAVEAVPCPAIRRHRARARAFSAFHGHVRRAHVFGDQLEIFAPQEANDAA